MRCFSTSLRQLPTLRRTPFVHSRQFTVSAPRALKEDAQRTPEQVDARKKQQLKEQEEGKGRWHEELGSQSESHVKADRENSQVRDHGEHIEELQEKTKKEAEKGDI